MSDKKYTLMESAAILIGGGFMGALGILLVIPIDLGLAWMRTLIWNWFFVSYLHLPHMSVWLMFAIMLFISMFRKSSRELKDEYYTVPLWKSLVTAYIIEGITFLLLFGVHLWELP